MSLPRVPRVSLLVILVAVAASSFPASGAWSGASLDRAASPDFPRLLDVRHRASLSDGPTLDPAGAIDAVSQYADVPIPETPLAAALPNVGNHDQEARAFGTAAGAICIVGKEDFRLWSRKSVDGGVTFAAEVPVGGAGLPDVSSWDAQISGDGKIYVALAVVGPTGGIELRATRSDDMGATWASPVTIVQDGSPAFSVTGVAVAVGSAGRAAIAMRGNDGRDAFVTATINSGVTWTTPVRIDGGAPPSASEVFAVDVSIDTSNRIQAVFVQNRGSGDTVFFTRSTDNGATFAAEAPVTLPFHTDSANPDLAIASDGNVLLALWDVEGPDHVYVLRSTNGGTSYTSVLDATRGDADDPLAPRLVTDAASATTFVHYLDSAGFLWTHRSTNSGLTWGGAFNITTSAAPGLQPPGAQLKRTATSTWVIAWSDRRTDTYARLRYDVYARASTNDGLTFGTEARVDTGTSAGASASRLTGMTAHSANNVFLVYADGRNDTDRSDNIWSNRSAVPLAFGPDARVDVDGGTRQAWSGWDRTVVTDGVSHVYAAFRATTTGSFSDIYVAASPDAGRTFGVPIRVGDVTPGSRINLGPTLRAFPDGHVYLLYESDAGSYPGSKLREIRFNRSTDFGATWQSSDFLIGTVAASTSDSLYLNMAKHVDGTPDGTVYVVWSGAGTVYLRKSVDFGATFAAASDIDQSTTGNAIYPGICATGDRIIVTMADGDASNTYFTLYATISNDRGLTWSPRTDLRSPVSNVGLFRGDPSLPCGPGGTTALVWPEDRTGAGTALYTNAFNGTAWSGESVIPISGALDTSFPADAEFVTASVVLASYQDVTGAIHVARSTDGGATFPSSQRIDDAAPRPASDSWAPRIASDGAGIAWVRFLDASAGGFHQLVARASSDAGVTYGPLRRVETFLPQASRDSERELVLNFVTGKDVAALPGAAMFVWGGQRDTYVPWTLFNVWDATDLDRDGQPAATDCNDANATVKTVPVELAGVTVDKTPSGARVAWTSQGASAGSSTVYDLSTGVLADLRATGTFAAASCLQNDAPDAPYDDVRPNPGAGSGWYYILRAHNSCGVGTYGDASIAPDPRDALDTASPCP